ncbi:MAG TPA: GIY-YIG nuclease family protein [Gemmatimonadales bacterium]|jgi:putative endonuclease|nr:GIY-YIG nuclease family protein [Gemmatimonadales bacterium]
MRDTPYAVYILTSRQRRVLYTGVTNDLRRRVAEHRSGQGGAFSRRYSLDTLVWYEWHADITAAIAREKQIKAGSRARKIRLIEHMNPEWRDLSGEL